MIVKGFEVPYLVEREYMAGVPQEWWLFSGLVRPEAEVTVNGLPLLVEPSLIERGWWSWGAPDAEGGSWSLPLAEGENTVIFEALFADGDTLAETRTIVVDSTLTGRASAFQSLVDDDSPTVRIDIGTYEGPECPEDACDIGDSELRDVPVAEDAVFKMLSIDGWTYHGYDFEGFVGLLAFSEEGNCRPCNEYLWTDDLGPRPECPDRCFFGSEGTITREGSYVAGPPYGLLGISLINAEGELRQFTQLFEP